MKSTNIFSLFNAFGEKNSNPSHYHDHNRWSGEETSYYSDSSNVTPPPSLSKIQPTHSSFIPSLDYNISTRFYKHFESAGLHHYLLPP